MPPIDAREKLESPRDSVICMCCGKYGHVMCLTLPMPKNRAMYCPDCGFSGHNVEYVRYPDEEPSCRNPSMISHHFLFYNFLELQRYRRRSDESASSTSNYGRDNEKRKGYFDDDDDISNKPPTQRRNITFPSHFDQNHSTSENSRRNADNNRTVRRAGSAFSRGGSSSGGYKGRIIHR